MNERTIPPEEIAVCRYRLWRWAMPQLGSSECLRLESGVMKMSRPRLDIAGYHRLLFDLCSEPMRGFKHDKKKTKNNNNNSNNDKKKETCLSAVL